MGLPWPVHAARTTFTYRVSSRTSETPETAHRRLNHVFVSEDLIDRVSVTALNKADKNLPDYWGPSDHCRILIEIGE